MANNLPVSRLINVQVFLSPAAAQSQNLSSLLVLGSSLTIDTLQRIRSYETLDAVAQDFGNSSPEYLSALLWFQQAPQPTSLLIGRWAKTAAAGQLLCGPLSATYSSVTAWNAISTGAFKVAIDGAAAADVTGLNFSTATNLNNVASIIDTALTGATVAYDSVNNRFVFTSATTGATSSVSFLTSPTTGTDISGFLGGLASSSGAYVADGIAAETALEAVQLFENRFSQQWYALMIPEAVNADHLAVAGYIEATNTKHLYGVTTLEGGTLSAVSTSDIGYQLAQLKYKRSITQYSATNAYAVASLFGRALTVNYNGNATTITLMYKQEPGIVAETLSQTQIAAVEAKLVNVFVNYNNNTAIIERGTTASGNYIDEITGLDWLSTSIQTALYNVLYLTTTKVPQTDAGNHLLATTIESVCSQGVDNGFLAPGTWQASGFGSLNTGDYLSKGFYVYAPPASSQAPQDRAARKSVPFQIAVKLAGAVQTVDVLINVNR